MTEENIDKNLDKKENSTAQEEEFNVTHEDECEKDSVERQKRHIRHSSTSEEECIISSEDESDDDSIERQPNVHWKCNLHFNEFVDGDTFRLELIPTELIQKIGTYLLLSDIDVFIFTCRKIGFSLSRSDFWFQQCKLYGIDTKPLGVGPMRHVHNQHFFRYCIPPKTLIVLHRNAIHVTNDGEFFESLKSSFYGLFGAKNIEKNYEQFAVRYTTSSIKSLKKYDVVVFVGGDSQFPGFLEALLEAGKCVISTNYGTFSDPWLYNKGVNMFSTKNRTTCHNYAHMKSLYLKLRVPHSKLFFPNERHLVSLSINLDKIRQYKHYGPFGISNARMRAPAGKMKNRRTNARALATWHVKLIAKHAVKTKKRKKKRKKKKGGRSQSQRSKFVVRTDVRPVGVTEMRKKKFVQINMDLCEENAMLLFLFVRYLYNRKWMNSKMKFEAK